MALLTSLQYWNEAQAFVGLSQELQQEPLHMSHYSRSNMGNAWYC